MSKKPIRWHTGSAVFLTALVALFTLVGTPPVVEAVLKLLPTAEVAVDITSTDSYESGGGFVGRGGGSSGGMNYFLNVRTTDGEDHKIRVPAKLHHRASGAIGLSDVQMHVTRPGSRPVAISVAKKPILSIDPGSVLERAINAGKSEPKETPESATKDVERQYYSLLTKPMGLLIGGAFCWAIVGWLLWKLPGKNTFPWPILIVGMTLAIAGGTWWGLAG